MHSRRYIKNSLTVASSWCLSSWLDVPRVRRVHVSSRTLSFLDDQFEVEAAHGEKREQVLRTAGIETYFILRARNLVFTQHLIGFNSLIQLFFGFRSWQMNQPPEVEQVKSDPAQVVASTLVCLDGQHPKSNSAVPMMTMTTTTTTPDGWCGCFKRCGPVSHNNKTTLVVETAGENHSLLPNHQEQQFHSGLVDSSSHVRLRACDDGTRCDHFYSFCSWWWTGAWWTGAAGTDQWMPGGPWRPADRILPPICWRRLLSIRNAKPNIDSIAILLPSTICWPCP